MKKYLLSLLAFAAAWGVNAQVVEVQSIQQVPLEGKFSANVARLSPDGSFAIVSNSNDNSLHRVDITSGAVSKVASNGNIQTLVFTPDGTNIVYKTSTTAENRLRYHSIEAIDLSNGRTRVLSNPARNSGNYTIAPSGNLTISAEGKIKAHNLKGNAVNEKSPVVGIYRGHLQLTKADGTTVNLDPQGKGSYLWASLSPDQTMISYYLVGKGCHVCNIDGSDVRKIGYVHAPVWLGNDAIVGFQDYDNGEVLTSSAVVAANLNGTIQTLTDSSQLALFPSVSSDASKIAYTTDDGKLFVVTLK